MNAFCISTLLIPFESISLHASCSLSSSADSSRTSSSVSSCSKIGGAITHEHVKLAKLNQQNSINKTRNLSKSKLSKPEIRSTAETQVRNRVMKTTAKFTNRTLLNAKRNLL